MGERGVIIGYDDETLNLYTLKIDGNEEKQLVADTKKLALSHLRGEEWCENVKGLATYDALIEFVGSKLSVDTAWNLEYYLGTYAALKWYAWKFFEKYNQQELAELYKSVYEAWKSAFDCKCVCDITEEERIQISNALEAAKKAEMRAMDIMAAC